ncbi:MAG: hypothetical protein R3F13_07255 [Prosthecobacter sp.]
MSQTPDEDPRQQGSLTHNVVPEPRDGGSPTIGAFLSFISIIMLAFILRLAVPKEDSALELGVLLVAIGFAQIWLIFNFLKSFKK